MFEAGNYTRKSLKNSEYGGVPHVSAETYTLKLFSDVVDLDGVGTELTTAGYAPVEFDNDATNFPLVAEADDPKANAVVLQTDIFTEDSPAIRSAGIFDENGNLRYRKVYPANTVYVLTGNVFKQDVGQLTYNPS